MNERQPKKYPNLYAKLRLLIWQVDRSGKKPGGEHLLECLRKIVKSL